MNNVPFFNTSQSWTQPALLKLAVILFGLFQVQVVAAQSQQGGEEQTTQLEQNPPYQQYEVKAGETLYSISKSLDVEIEELRVKKALRNVMNNQCAPCAPYCHEGLLRLGIKH